MIKVLSKRNLTKGILFGLILAFSYSCVGPEEVPKPDNLLAEETYVDLLVEIQHVITYHNSYPDSVNADSLTALIYDKYQVKEEEFLISHQYYQTQVKKQIDRVDEAIRRIRAEEDLLNARIDSLRKVNARKDSIARADTSQIRPDLQDQSEIIEQN